jgi:predicted metal-dependent HD superfamily phosphohydrolase
VKLFGYLHTMFEDSALYLSKDYADYLAGAYAIWVSYDSAVKLEPIVGAVKDLHYFNGRYVMLEGFFNMKERGHTGIFSGGLEKVVRVLELRRWYDGRKDLTKTDERERIIPQRRRR